MRERERRAMRESSRGNGMERVSSRSSGYTETWPASKPDIFWAIALKLTAVILVRCVKCESLHLWHNIDPVDVLISPSFSLLHSCYYDLLFWWFQTITMIFTLINIPISNYLFFPNRLLQINVQAAIIKFTLAWSQKYWSPLICIHL